MIQVFIPDNFIAERSYAVKTLLHHYCKCEIEIIPQGYQVDYILAWEGKLIVIEDHFFGLIPDGETYLQTKYIPDQVIPTQSVGLDQIMVLYGDEQLEVTRDKIVCHVDLFAGAFFMLTRWEEAVKKDKDLHGRFPAAEALLVKSGQILRPVVDEYVALLRYWLLTLGYPLPSDDAKYKVVPTCDVDVPYYWRSKPAWKLLAGGFRRNPFHFFKDLKAHRAVKNGKKKDPYDQFDYLMTLAEKADTRFEFNMIGGGDTRFEGYYEIGDEHIKALMKRMMGRGHRIGAHPSYDSFKDADMMKKEIKAISFHSGSEISSSRQHYLRFEVADTWRCLASAGIKTDSTLGYAAEPGFRCGTSKPFPVFDIQERKELPLMERPLLIMDVSFRMYKKYTVDESLAVSKKIITEVKKHNGELVFLWHNSSLSEIDGWEGWNRVLESFWVH
ncbi:MAG TPA: polysaccharide deacetylase family protein [Saprospiraceae bacterium]|nr:polysaccharide deacetylase family protein [Saprospiraceae bacterium]